MVNMVQILNWYTVIKANELRVGNWVNVLHGNMQIDHFTKDGAHFTDGCGGNWQSLQPIILTWKELDEFGFINYHTNPRLEYFYANTQGYYPVHVYTSRGGEVMYNDLHLKYVHQLQNLYFALTGEELEINL